jgi:hypothetical protein
MALTARKVVSKGSPIVAIGSIGGELFRRMGYFLCLAYH